MYLVCILESIVLVEKYFFEWILETSQSLYIRLHVCESVCDSGHLVPGTNSEIEGLTLANSETNNRKEWD